MDAEQDPKSSQGTLEQDRTAAPAPAAEAAAAAEPAEAVHSPKAAEHTSTPAESADSAAADNTVQGTAAGNTPADAGERTRRQLLQTARLNQLQARIDEILSSGGLLSRRQPHFKERPGQLQMARQVCAALHSHELLIAEAGTGTGKTFAYLIPALLEGRSVVISTGSKALQDQLVQVDIPNLLRLLGLEGTSFMGLKGFGNYLCHRRWRQAVLSGEINKAEQDLVERFAQKVENELMTAPEYSSFGDVNAALPMSLASRLTISRSQCLGDKCSYCADQCFPFKARHYAARSQIVVINHALLFAALSSHGYEDAGGQFVDARTLPEDQLQPKLASGELRLHFWFLPDFQALICDEAHMLPDFGRNFYARQFDAQTLNSWSRQLNRELEQLKFEGRLEFKKLSDELQHALQLTREYLERFAGRHNFLELLFENYDDNLRYQPAPLQLNQQFRGYMVDLYRILVNLDKKLESNKSTAPEVMEMLQTELRSQLTALVELMQSGRPGQGRGQGQDRSRVCVAEVGPHGFTFSSIPLEIGPYFEQDLKKLLTAGTGITLTSATLSVSGDFKKFAADIGAQFLPHQTLIVPSSFDYASQACLYVSDRFPAVEDEERNAKLVSGLQPVIEAVPGGIFVLTTSHRSLQELSELLTERFGSQRLVLAQAGGRSNAQIMQEFKRDGRAILIGTSSFWAGVDVPGQALSLVIIDKLPFASPADPFARARCRRLEEQGGSPFAHITLPEAIIALRQGAGRLIRSESDSGGLIICDPRLVTQRTYSSRFLRALPPMHRCRSLREMIAFINRTSAGSIQQ